MVQTTVRYGVIATLILTSFLSLVILISAARHNDAQAKTRTAGGLACGQQLKQQCGGVPVQANSSSVSKRTKKSFTDDASSWRTMLCVGATETQCSIAKLSSRVKATFSDVLQPLGVWFPGDATRLSTHFF